MGRCFFVSDLHLFANRSLAEQYQEAILRAASGARDFVLGGDIFDFRWATHTTTWLALDAAEQWLRDLAEQCPQCHFHFLLGNHDHHQGLIHRLSALEAELPNLSWHRYYLRLGSSVFLHGDVAERKTDAAMLAASRSRWLNGRRRGLVLRRVYDAVVSAGLHRPVPYVLYRRRTVARRILAYLEDIGQGPQHGVRNVYFGHTHRSMSHYHYRGVTFHNGGAPIKGVRFRILEVGN